MANAHSIAVVAKDAREAAQVYPASSWASLLEPPKPSEFPGTGPTGNGINPSLKTQADWLTWLRRTSISSHRMRKEF